MYCSSVIVVYREGTNVLQYSVIVVYREGINVLQWPHSGIQRRHQCTAVVS